MFTKHQHPTFLDLSNDVQDENDWAIGHLRTIDIPLDITAFAVEPVTKLLAVGTASGSIFIHGSPGVDVKINTPVSVGVKFLNFAARSQNLLCIDNYNQLHVWDLSTFGAPEYLASARFDPVNSIHISPSLCHVFLGLQNGDLKTYDLACLRKSPFTAPNMWKLYQKSVLASGVPSMVQHPSTSAACVDQVLHPRDLNQIFVAYEGGVILSNITERSTVRAYELILPPGAPGGSGYGAADILTHRQPPVTCLSVHPSGHLFAVGHADGSIAFWAVDDDNAPLTVFTFDEDNVHRVDSTKLEAHLQNDDTATKTVSIREPIIKLAWSGYPNSPDPRGGETTLTVLGGLDPIRGGNITTLWFPALQPQDPPVGDKLTPGELHPFFRNAMLESVSPIDLAEYEFEGEAQDFLLLPKDNPHYAGVYDPYAMLCLVANIANERVIQACSFPPSRTIVKSSLEQRIETTPSETASSLAALDISDDFEHESNLLPFHSLSLPFQLISGGSGLASGRLLTLDNAQYERIREMGATSPEQSKILLNGGKAFADRSRHEETRLIKYQPRRIMITCNDDLRALFFDVSAQLQIDGGQQESLSGRFPDSLPGLTVELESVWHELVARGKRSGPKPRSIQAVYLAPEALEVASVLDTGDVIVHRCNPAPTSFPEGTENEDITVLHSASTDTASRFFPYFALKGPGPVEACSISDVGFLAVSYSSGGVIIVDMRGPRIIHRIGQEAKLRHSIPFPSTHGADVDAANALTWTVSALEDDHQLRVRLLISYHSGSLEVVTLLPSGSPATWGASSQPAVVRGIPEPILDGSFVLDGKTGNRRGATGSLLASSFHSQTDDSVALFVTVGAKGAKSFSNITGDRLGKVDWGIRAGSTVTAQIVERMASRALVVITDKDEAITYSLPGLETITRFKLLPVDRGLVSIDASGDFVVFSPDPASPSSKAIRKITYGTLFDFRRTYSPPEIDFAIQPCKIPQPQPIAIGPPSIVGTWLNFRQTWSGEQLDNALGGPDRPLPVRKVSAQVASPLNSGSGIASAASTTAASVAASAASAQASIYDRLSSALNERGQLLGGLEEGFNALQQGSQNMATQAKKLAAQQTAKSWFGF